MTDDQPSYFDSGEFREMLERYEQMFISGNPCYLDGIDAANIADYYQSTGNVDKAEEAIRYGLSLHPGDTDILITQAHGLLMRGKSAEARAILESLPEQGSREQLFLAGCIELFENDAEMADICFSQSVEAGSKDNGLLSDIITKFIDYGQFDKAQQWLDKALLEDPQSRTFHELQADLYYSIQDFDKAIEQYNLLIDEYAYDTYYWEQLAFIWFQREDYEKAIECFDFLYAINPDAEGLEYPHVQSLIETGRVNDAEPILDRILKKEPDSVPALTYYGYCESMQEHHEEALKYFTKAAKLDPEDASLMAKKGTEEFDCGKYKAAADSFAKAFNGGFLIDPDMLMIMTVELIRQDEIAPCYMLLKPVISASEEIASGYTRFLPSYALVCWLLRKPREFRTSMRKAMETDDRETIMTLFGLTDCGQTTEQIIEDLLTLREHEQEEEHPEPNNP